MAIERHDPDTLWPSGPSGVAQVVVASGRTIWVNGMVSYDVDRSVVGLGDHVAQARKSWENLAAALAAVGATGNDVTYYRVNLVDATPEIAAEVMRVGREVFADSPLSCGAIVTGVTMLGRAEFLVEIEATAVLD